MHTIPSHQSGANCRCGSSRSMTRRNTSVIETPTPVNTIKFTIKATPGCGIVAVKNQLIGIEAIIASPPQLTVTSAANSVLLAANREPERLLRMYNAGNGIAQASPAENV